MSRFNRANSFEADTSAWGGTTPVPEAEVEIDPAAIAEKELLVKEIVGMQDGLRALLERVTEVQTEGSKLKSDNEMLQTYIDNLTRNKSVLRSRSSKGEELTGPSFHSALAAGAGR